ncbi:MAG: undecaprenyl-diphosphate phosphatase [Nannocystaceae bacterium]
MAAGLGALQGVTEFLPISSSGHLSLAQIWLGVDLSAVGHRFNIVVHAGTLVAVLWEYRRDLVKLLRGVFVGDAEARKLFLGLVIATLPLGLVLTPPIESTILAVEANPRWIGVGLWITAALLTFAHLRRPRDTGGDVLPSPPSALAIGLFQLLAVTPGISRSGSTIAAGVGLGLSRVAAARFSFLLSIPAILGASAKESLAILREPAPATDEWTVFAIGFAVSLVVGLLSLRLLVHLLVRVGLLPFVPYLVLAGAAAYFAG